MSWLSIISNLSILVFLILLIIENRRMKKHIEDLERNYDQIANYVLFRMQKRIEEIVLGDTKKDELKTWYNFCKENEKKSGSIDETLKK